jgi:hypothetical protein
MTSESHYPDQVVVNTLTSEGVVPLELCFVLRNCIYRWHSDQGVFTGFMIEKDLADVCRQYLQLQGLSFRDSIKLADWVRSHNWPNLDKCLSLIECWT